MCGPFAIPLALMVAGSGLKFLGDRKADKASTRSFNAERQRQEDLSGQQNARFQDSLAKSQELLGPGAREKAASAREGTLAAAIVPQSEGGYLPGSSSAPSVVGDTSARTAAASQATSLNLARTLAALGGTGDQLQEVNTQIGRNSGLIGQLASFKAGSAGVLDAELKAAAQKGSTLRGFGGLAQQIGSAMMPVPGAGGGATAGMNAGAAKANGFFARAGAI